MTHIHYLSFLEYIELLTYQTGHADIKILLSSYHAFI